MSKRHVIILLLGLLLFVPSLWAGFILDDFYYLGAIEGHFPQYNTSRNLFTFFINDEAATRDIARQGGNPWWIDERVRGESFRPLSDLLLRADHTIFGKSAFGYHWHSLAWWAATLLACGFLFRRVLPGIFGTLAFLLFAIDPVHVMPVSWIANRNALVALAPMLFGLWAWIRWREDGWRAGCGLGPLGVVIGLAASELGLAVLGYFAAYELVGARSGAVRTRLARLTPFIALGIVYVVIYRLLGYSSAYSGVYHHPLQDPVGYMKAAVTAIPTLLSGGIAGFSADFWMINPSLRPALVVVGCLAAVGLLTVLRACRGQLDDAIWRSLRWLLTGTALSLLPVAAVFPSDRMLLVPKIGLTAATAAVVVLAVRSWRGQRRWWLIVAGGFLAVVHLVLAPLVTIGIETLVIKSGRASRALAVSPIVAEAAGKEAILIFAPDAVLSVYLPVMIDFLGSPAPKSWRPLSIAPYDHWLRRTGPRTFELEVAKGGVMLRSIFEELYRDPKNSLAPGTVIDRGLLQAEIKAANDRGPTCIAFHFDRDLSDPTLDFLIWQDGELRHATIPAIGEAVLLKRTLGPAGF